MLSNDIISFEQLDPGDFDMLESGCRMANSVNSDKFAPIKGK